MAVVQRHVMKQGDLLPVLELTLLDGTAPVPLDDATAVTLKLRRVGSSTIVEKAMTKLLATGKVQYEWVAGDTDVVGDYAAEVEVTWPDGPRTFPDDDFVYVQITENLS